MRTNSSGVTEVASIRTDLETYGKEHTRIFGERKEFCDKCGKRIVWCECEEHEPEVNEDGN